MTGETPYGADAGACSVMPGQTRAIFQPGSSSGSRPSFRRVRRRRIGRSVSGHFERVVPWFVIRSGFLPFLSRSRARVPPVRWNPLGSSASVQPVRTVGVRVLVSSANPGGETNPATPADRTAFDRAAHAKGKLVTVITGLDPEANDLNDLGARLKNACGAGGTVKEGRIELQGDHRSAAERALRDIGYKTKAGRG